MTDMDVAQAILALTREIEKLRLVIKAAAGKEANYQREIISATEHGGWADHGPDAEEMLP